MRLKIIIIVIFLFTPFIKALNTKSNNIILYNLNSDEILYEKNSHEPIKIASLTKIMTGIIAIEEIDDLNKEVLITAEMLDGLKEANASVVGLKVNDIVSYRDLLYALLLPSGGDAANALAISISGSIENFVKLMNNKANSLGLNNTLFTNATGLDNGDNHSNVFDVATILRYALKNAEFKKIYETKKYTMANGMELIASIERSSQRLHLNVNYIKGSKTGSTSLAGVCLSSTFDYNDINYLMVNCDSSFKNATYNVSDAETLYNYYSNNYHLRSILKKDKVIKSINNKYSSNKVNLYPNTDYSLYMLDNDYENLKFTYDGLETIDIYTRDKIIGKYEISLNNNVLKTIDVYKPDKIEFSIFRFIFINYIYFLIILIFIVLIFIINLFLKKKKSFKTEI